MRRNGWFRVAFDIINEICRVSIVEIVDATGPKWIVCILLKYSLIIWSFPNVNRGPRGCGVVCSSLRNSFSISYVGIGIVRWFRMHAHRKPDTFAISPSTQNINYVCANVDIRFCFLFGGCAWALPPSPVGSYVVLFDANKMSLAKWIFSSAEWIEIRMNVSGSVCVCVRVSRWMHENEVERNFCGEHQNNFACDCCRCRTRNWINSIRLHVCAVLHRLIPTESNHFRRCDATTHTHITQMPKNQYSRIRKHFFFCRRCCCGSVCMRVACSEYLSLVVRSMWL